MDRWSVQSLKVVDMSVAQKTPQAKARADEAQLLAEAADGAVVQPERHPREVLPPEAPPAVHPVEGGRLQSERVVISAPMSYSGSAARIWPISRMSENGAATAGLIALAIVVIGLAWVAVTAWYIGMYVVFGLLFIPYRLIRRGNRKRKMENLRHREQLGMQMETQAALRQRQQ